MEQLNLGSPPPPLENAPLEAYRPVSNGTRLAGEKDGVLGDVDDTDLLPIAKIVLLLVVLALALVVLAKIL